MGTMTTTGVRKQSSASVAPTSALKSFFAADVIQNPTFEGFLQKGIANPLQAKLRVNRLGDEYEQEADRVADEVVKRPATPESSRIAGYSSRQRFGRPSSASDITGSSGNPLDARTRSFMETRFDHDFSEIRVHTDRQAASAAGSLNARAFTMGRDIVFGSGQYVSGTHEGKRLLAHELTHTIQQQAGLTGLNVQRTAIDDAREKLSYAWNDWAITDSDAMEALAFLGSIPEADLAKELKRLESKYVTRLLDNLPNLAKSGDIYKRVIQALGSARIQPYATEQLSYSWWLPDAVITDAEVTRVFNLFANLAGPEQEKFLTDLNANKRLNRLIDNSNTGHHALYIRPWIASLTKGGTSQQQRNILRVIVQNTDDDALETIKLATEVRFKVDVRKSRMTGHPSADWEPGSLRQTYLTLDRLPEGHVAANPELLHLGQFKEPSTVTTKGDKVITSTVAGIYSRDLRELAINAVDSGEAEGTIMHETGHAVDRMIGWSVGTEPANPKRGGWKIYGSDYHTCAVDIVDDSGGAIKTTLNAAQRGDVVDEMDHAMSNRTVSGLEGKIRALPWFAGLKAPDKTKVVEDRAFKALDVGLKSPWFNATDGGEHLRDHVYEESYAHDWSRYNHEARSRMLKPYQFRQADEWFAEAYAFYYTPDPRGKGEKLGAIDRDTKNYFDTSVDKAVTARPKP